MRYVNDERSMEEYRKFLETHPGGHFLQSPEWAEVKTGWKHEIILAEDGEGRIAGSMSVLIRRAPVFGNLIYCARGPFCQTGDLDALRQLTEGCRELMAKYDAYGVRLEPDVPEGDEMFRAAMTSLGWRFRPTRDALDTVQPRSLFRLDLRGRTEEEILAGFHKKLRYNIRLAQRHGVTVREGTRGDLERFADLMAVTASRDGFLGRNGDYYRRMWDCLGPGRVSLLLAEYRGETLAAGLFVHYAHKTWYGYGASSNSHRNMMPCHLLQWEAIRRALARGDQVYDLRGFLEIADETDPRAGLYRFKKQFGAKLVRLVGEIYLTDDPRKYELSRRAERLVRRTSPLRSKLRALLTPRRREDPMPVPQTHTP